MLHKNLFYITLFSLVVLILLESFGTNVTEGFANAMNTVSLPQKTSYWATFAASRSDIGPDSKQEDSSYIRDPRYFNDYADVSRLGVKYDFCRLLSPVDDQANSFFACALAGTENLESTQFRTDSVKQGFKTSKDDYMHDTNGDGRQDYCRILKWKDGTYQPLCLRARELRFDSEDIVDSSPPSDIQTLLSFYDGCVLWLRMFGDLNDSVGSLSKTQISGNMIVDETPRRNKSEGIQFNGSNQYLRLSDSPSFSLGYNVPMRSIRTWMVWVYFEEFTNNAKIFDFGNGAGNDNVFLGILGKGDPSISASSDQTEWFAPTELSPQEFMKNTDANVNDYTCYPTLTNRKNRNAKMEKGSEMSATLLYEVWDKRSRKLQIKVNKSIPLKTWTHITVTTKDNDPTRPEVSIYINGKRMASQGGGFLPSTEKMTNCYIGKSNWADTENSMDANRDELFKGKMLDFRVYKKAVSEEFIKDSISWGKNIIL